MRENLEKIFNRFKSEIGKYPNLTEIFNTKYLQDIETQIDNLVLDASTHINPVFLSFLRDENEGKLLLKKLSNNIEIIFKKVASENIKKHIAGQLRTIEAQDTLVELSILGNLLSHFPPENIELYPPTIDNRDVEAKVRINARWVFIEVSVLKDSKLERDEITEALRSGNQPKGRWIDLNKDKFRLLGKVSTKSKQFPPDSPNALFIVFTGVGVSFHDFPTPLDKIDIEDVSSVFEFDRELNYKTCKPGLSSNPLTEIEMKELINFLKSEKWQSIF